MLSMTVEELACCRIIRIDCGRTDKPDLTTAAKKLQGQFETTALDQISPRSILSLRLHSGPYPSAFSLPTTEPRARVPRPRCFAGNRCASLSCRPLRQHRCDGLAIIVLLPVMMVFLVGKLSKTVQIVPFSCRILLLRRHVCQIERLGTNRLSEL